MTDEYLNRPYIGYRSAGRRPESQQDRRASADSPLAALRGLASGILGAPGDLESLVRMLPGLSERTILPTSEDVEQRLPLRSVSQTPVGRVATTGGQLAGGFYNGPGSPLRAIASLPSAVSRAGREFLQSNVPVHVVKPKGGNWLAGSVEEAIAPLKRPEAHLFEHGQPATNLEELQSQVDRAAALNQWLDTKLAKYMRNEMATPEDPLRALAERGVTHVDPEQFYYGTREVHPSGEVLQKLGVSPAARAWENASDYAVASSPAEIYQNFGSSNLGLDWVNKLDPKTPFYRPYGQPARDLGFGHLRDELRNALNPESGLPAALRLTPEQLGNVSTPQAVELVSKINEYRAAEKAAADLARATGPATHTFKEYPETGFKWVELKARGPKATSIEGAKTDQELIRQELEQALKYEGDTMGHCVGNYCPDVLEGKSRIFSLRSAKGKPHVTVEVATGVEGEPMSIVQIKGKQNRAPKEDYLPYVQDFVKSQKWGRVGDIGNAGLFSAEDYFGREQLQGIRDLGFAVPDYLSNADARALEESVLKKTTEGFASGGLVTYNPAAIDEIANPLRAALGLQ